MSFLESPKSRFPAFTPVINSTQLLKPGCVQCGSLLDVTDHQKSSLSGKCISCEYWVSDEEESEFDDCEY